jgi:hypothetical protein
VFTGTVLIAEEKPEAILAAAKELSRQPAVAGRKVEMTLVKKEKI